MLPSIDTYLREEIKSKLKIILTNRYIIEEILKGIQPEVAENFIKKYAGESGKEIPVIYTMPQDKQTQQGAIYIGLREGAESSPSLGNLEGVYSYIEDERLKEESIVQADENNKNLFIEVSKPIGDFNVENITFSRSDNVTVEGNKIYFTYDPELVGLEVVVDYVSSKGDEVGLKKGFTAKEQYSILVVSTNMDVVRCLDLVVKAILILMRASKEEHTNFLLQNVQFGQIEEVVVSGEQEGKNPEILYGRESIVTYTSSYSLDSPIVDFLKKINVNVRLDVEESDTNG